VHYGLEAKSLLPVVPTRRATFSSRAALGAGEVSATMVPSMAWMPAAVSPGRMRA
jgi:hypothetical protein